MILIPPDRDRDILHKGGDAMKIVIIFDINIPVTKPISFRDPKAPFLLFVDTFILFNFSHEKYFEINCSLHLCK